MKDWLYVKFGKGYRQSSKQFSAHIYDFSSVMEIIQFDVECVKEVYHKIVEYAIKNQYHSIQYIYYCKINRKFCSCNMCVDFFKKSKIMNSLE